MSRRTQDPSKFTQKVFRMSPLVNVSQDRGSTTHTHCKLSTRSQSSSLPSMRPTSAVEMSQRLFGSNSRNGLKPAPVPSAPRPDYRITLLHPQSTLESASLSSRAVTVSSAGNLSAPRTAPSITQQVPGRYPLPLQQASKQASALRSYATFTLLGEPTQDPSLQSLLSTLSESHAKSTKGGIMTALRHASKPLGLSPLEMATDHPDLITSQATLALNQKLLKKDILPSTANKYSMSIKSLITRLPGVPTQDLNILKDFSRSMVKKGANLPTNVALPLKRHHVRRLLHQYTRVDEQAATYLAWKTCSRWDEIPSLLLPLEHYPEASHLFITWLDGTKIGAKNPFLPRLLTVVQYSSGLPITPEILTYLTTHRGLLCPHMTTAKMQTRLQLLPVDPADLTHINLLKDQHLRPHYTCHSFKKGATDFLWDMWQQGKLEKPEIIERLSKHAPPGTEVVGDLAIRYASRRYPLALALETHLATRLL